MPVNVVLGAGGPTGFQCVKRLLEVTDLPVRAVVRDPAKYKERFEEAAGACVSNNNACVSPRAVSDELHNLHAPRRALCACAFVSRGAGASACSLCLSSAGQ